MKTLCTKIITLILVTSLCNAQLYINEIMASNTSTVTDNAGNFSDWFEIYNASASPVDLANYYVTDNASNRTKFRFTSAAGMVVVPANGYLVIWASENLAAGPLHTNFGLSANGERVILTAPNGTTKIDSVGFGPQRENVSFGRFGDGTNTLKFFSPSTFNSTNNSANAYNGFLNSPTFSQIGGFFNSSFNLSISHSDPAATIYYTTDGSEPVAVNNVPVPYSYKNIFPQNAGDPLGPLLQRNMVSYQYSSAIPINDPNTLANQISNIASTWHNLPFYFPSYGVRKAVIIRAIATKPGFLASNPVTHTFFFNASGTNDFNFPVISTVMQESFLFDYNTGIYTAGKAFDDFKIATPTANAEICSPANYKFNGSAWERKGNFEYFTAQNSAVNQYLGIRIQGNCSPAANHKSLRYYGLNNFSNYSFFPEAPSLKHARIIARNSGNDYNQTLLKDVFVHRWLGHLNFASQKSRPSIIFMNGEYWGITDLRERIDNQYLNRLFNVDAGNLDVRQVNFDTGIDIEEGDTVHYYNMEQFIKNNNMAIQANYDQAKTYMDPENFSDYQAAEIFIGNIDWPQNNVRSWRLRVPYTPTAPYGHDGRHRWILFDTERGLGEVVNATNDDLGIAINKPSNILFKKLLENPDFKNDFITTMANMMNSVTKPTHSQTLFNSFKNIYQPEIQNHINRWKNIPDITAWNTQCNKVLNYLGLRSGKMDTLIKNQFSIAGDYLLTLTTPDTSQGYLNVNRLIIKSNKPGMPANVQSWTGRYYDNIALKIKANANAGFVFSHWVHNGNIISSPEIIVNTAINNTYTAYFMPADVFPTTGAPLSTCKYSLTDWANTQPAGSHPPYVKFIYLNTVEPTLNSIIAGKTSGMFNLSSGTRVDGLNLNGLAFYNSSSPNVGYPTTQLGGLVLAINTTNLSEAILKFTASTLTNNTKNYNIRLQYRVGFEGQFIDTGIEYLSNITGHNQTFTYALPLGLMNKSYIQLLFKYYYSGSSTSGSADYLSLDDITINSKMNHTGTSSINFQAFTPSVTTATMQLNTGQSNKFYSSEAVELLPGFKAENGSIFSAQIRSCTLP